MASFNLHLWQPVSICRCNGLDDPPPAIGSRDGVHRRLDSLLVSTWLRCPANLRTDSVSCHSSSGDFCYTHSPWRLSCYTIAPAWLSGWKCLRRSISGTDHWQCDCSDAHADATAASADADARDANAWRGISPVSWGGSIQYESADIRYGRC
ncbi:uncharacterized protein [Drosophila pseudoobscura]|uniref:Uncharacterized protein isoform X1 n=1 Tax=Drosophila pseudoobscura pseudoobscura TaxID=46245 RepID=A0A6I8VFW8_DROPS|nr:uncharacterized protein LOC4805192 isoform X1 [Drosophila pseudoobscura]